MSPWKLAIVLLLVLVGTAAKRNEDEIVEEPWNINFHGLDRLNRDMHTTPPVCNNPVEPGGVDPRPQPPIICIFFWCELWLIIIFPKWGDVILIFICEVHAIIIGDPHYTTFDALSVDYHGTCTYILTDSTCFPGVPQFRVLGTNHHETPAQAVSGVTSVKEVIVEVYGHTIIIGQGMAVTVDGNPLYGPHFFGSPTSTYVGVVPMAGSMAIVTDFGLIVTFNGIRRLTVNVPIAIFAGKLCGIMGNADGNPNNDLVLPDGTPATDVNQFGDAWKDAGHSPPLCLNGTFPNYACATPAQEAEVALNCSILSNTTGPFAACHSIIPPFNYVFNCEADSCADFGNHDLLCDVYDAYATDCGMELGMIIDWRPFVPGCDIVCGSNAHYEDDVRPCDINTCHIPDQSDFCDTTDGSNMTDLSPLTSSGCVCDTGYLLEGTDCVDASDCGCTDKDGMYHKVGDSWSECGTTCQCDGLNNITCDCGFLVPAGCDKATVLCTCGNVLCPSVCEISPSGQMTREGVTTPLASNKKNTIAKTHGLGFDPCKIFCKVQTDSSGNIIFGGFKFGVHPKKPNKFRINFEFNGSGVTQKGFGISGVQNVTIPAGGFVWTYNQLRITIDELTTTSWELKAYCGADPELATYQYGTNGANSIKMDVTMPGVWQGRCYK